MNWAHLTLSNFDTVIIFIQGKNHKIKEKVMLSKLTRDSR